MRRRIWLVAVLWAVWAACLPPVWAQGSSKKVALVIGNGAYRSAPLKNPVADARAMAEQLRKLGFEVIERRDATREQMAFAIRDFGDRLRSASTGVFYYAGHGVQVRGRNYLIPVDTVAEREDEVPYRSIDANEVLDKIDSARAPVNVVILDACRNNPFARPGRSVGSAGGLASMDAPSGSLIAFSTAPGAVAEDGAGANGTYTKYLLRHIDTPGLAIEQMFKRVRVDVARETADRQIPWESSSLKTDFAFRPDARVPPRVDEATVELAFWDSVKNSSSAADYRAYLEQYPQGRFAALARVRAAQELRPAVQTAAPPVVQPAMPPADAAPVAAGGAPGRQARALPGNQGWIVVAPGTGLQWLAADGRPTRALADPGWGPLDALLQVEVSPGGEWLALLYSQQGSPALRLLPLRGPVGTALPPAQPLPARAVAMAWTVTGRDVLVAGQDWVAAVAVDPRSGRLTADAPWAQGGTTSWVASGMRLSPDSRWLAVTGQDAGRPEVRVLDVAQRREVWRTAAVAVDFSPRVSAALVAGVDGKARLVESASGRVLRELDTPGQVLEGRYSLGGELLTTRDTEGAITVWDAASAQRVAGVRAGASAGGSAGALAVNDNATAVLVQGPEGSRVVRLRESR